MLIESLEVVMGGLGVKYRFYVIPDKRLTRYVTSKSDAEKDKFKRPADIYIVNRKAQTSKS